LSKNMKRFRLFQVDSFTRELFRGNPAGVVTNADGLSEQQMRAIAREMNNSETAFILSCDDPACDVRVRFFTPSAEVPICGHATVAAHYARAMELGLDSCRVVQRTLAGDLPVDILRENGDYTIVMTQGAPVVSDPVDESLRGEILSAIGIAENAAADYPVAIASTGHSKVMVPIRSNQLLHSLKPDMRALGRISEKIGCNGYYVFTLNPGENVLVHGRMFAPAIGIGEDPVTGNANGPLGAYLVHYGILQKRDDPAFDFDILQGEAIGRAGGMRVHVEKEDGKPALVQISGTAVIAFATEIELPCEC